MILPEKYSTKNNRLYHQYAFRIQGTLDSSILPLSAATLLNSAQVRFPLSISASSSLLQVCAGALRVPMKSPLSDMVLRSSKGVSQPPPPSFPITIATGSCPNTTFIFEGLESFLFYLCQAPSLWAIKQNRFGVGVEYTQLEKNIFVWRNMNKLYFAKGKLSPFPNRL